MITDEKEMERAEQEAHVFLSEVQADYEEFIERLRGGIEGNFPRVRARGEECDYKLLVGRRTYSEVQVSKDKAKWVAYDGEKPLLTLSLPQPVCDKIRALMRKQ